MDKIHFALRNPGIVQCFPWLQSGAGFRPSTDKQLATNKSDFGKDRNMTILSLDLKTCSVFFVSE